MDPLTAFSLACGVIQIVDSGSRALSMCMEMYKQGELSEYKELEETTKHLVNAQKDIRLPGTGPSATGSQKPQDKELFEIAKDCSAIASELTTKLQTLKVPNPHRKSARFKGGFKAFREKPHIQKLQRRLDSYRKALDTHILLGLRQQLDLGTHLGPAIQDLSQRVQTMIEKLSQGPQNFDELAKAIRNEHAETREHITEQFLQYQQTQDYKEYRQRLLDSLWFNELWSREERIVDAHRKTFEWIFDSTGKGVGRWDNFVEWLECGKGIYWIKGKAGSGKSTLMSFLGQGPRIPDSLKVWATGKRIFVPKFYFWSGGTPMERSIEGLLRSLLWQILNQLPDLQMSDIGQRNGRQVFAEPIAAWTERRLRAQLTETVQQALQTHHLCFFIDGLDEFAGDQEGLIAFIQDTVQFPGIKMCLSSRPDQVFVQAFASSAKLQLQDLTENDIQEFVRDKLRNVPQLLPMVSQGSYWIHDLTKQILEKAQGVFLWVSLAVKDQIRGLRNGDSLEQLRERLTYLPDEVEGIYARMLSQIEKPYRREASVSLQIALHGKNSSLLSHILASRDDLDAILGSDDPMPELELVAMSDRIRKRIGIACAGLLEIHEREQENSDQEESIYMTTSMPRIDLRTTGSRAASDSRNSEFDEDAADHVEEGKSRFEGRKSSVNGEAFELGEEASVLNDQDPGFAYPIIETFSGEARGMEVISLQERVDVTFIHRTAVDFMRNEDAGGRFLRINTPSDFDPLVFHVKVLFARLRLFGYGKYSGNIQSIMDAIWEVEHHTGNEQTALCQIFDSIMWRIDRKYCGEKWGDNCHWSTRWGWSRLFDFRDDMLELYQLKHRKFQSTPLHGPKMGTGPKWDFLLLAASYGLHRYVEKNLDHEGLMCDRDVAAYLLYGSMLALSGKYFDLERNIASLDFANEILKRDVDLNSKVNDQFTLWSMFLWRMHQVFYSWMEHGIAISDLSHGAHLHNTFAKTALAFIDRGADLATEEILRVGLEMYNNTLVGYVYWLDLSALAILELCLKGKKELFRIRERCNSAGAIFYARCSMLQVKNFDFGRSTRDEYELSNSESSAFLHLYFCDFTKEEVRKSMKKSMIQLAESIIESRKEKKKEIDHLTTSEEETR